MQVRSGRWPTLLIYYLKEGTKRFSNLRRDNPTISHRMLTLELRKLKLAGIVRRTDFDGYPRRVEYGLTASGRALVPLLEALGDWWDGNAAPLEGSAMAGASESGGTCESLPDPPALA